MDRTIEVKGVKRSTGAEPGPCYAEYQALWHLHRINWDLVTGNHATSVALIDTGASFDHAYLENTGNAKDSIDFGAHPHGVAYSRKDPPGKLSFAHDLLDRVPLGMESKELLAELIAGLNGKQIRAPDPTMLQASFTAHGTACAGLLAAFPPAEASKRPIPYFGVDPLCRVISIATSLDPSPQQLITALLYALQKGVDVIVIPRGIATQWKEDPGEYDNPGNSLQGSTDGRYWQALEELLLAVSHRIPVVLAAGNSSESVLSYPASLAATNGGANGLISVGAATYKGYRSAYANHGEGLTLVAPSDDDEIFNRHQLRLDRCSRRARFHEYDTPESKAVPHSHQGVLSLDVPGPAGYKGGGTGDDSDGSGLPWFDPLSGGFTLFGGTSAASAIVAGVVAQMSRKAAKLGLPFNGGVAKAVLRDTARYDSGPVTPDKVWSLEVDDVNGLFGPKDDVHKRRRLLFGAGMVDMKAALARLEAMSAEKSRP